ncbi:competence protein CoiA family protein [Deinococcus hopiensis]
MTCCEERAVPKRSSRGLPFFAHARRHACPVAPETEFHLHAKRLIAGAVQSAGWEVDVEVPGLTPAGDGWRADVLASCGGQRVAFEVQRSGQTLEAIHARQERYAQSGIRGMWFLRGHAATLREPQPWLYQTPMFTVQEDFLLPTFGMRSARTRGCPAAVPGGGIDVDESIVGGASRGASGAGPRGPVRLFAGASCEVASVQRGDCSGSAHASASWPGREAAHGAVE